MYSEEQLKTLNHRAIPMEEIEGALLNGKTRSSQDVRSRQSKRYYNKKALITLNPATGELIQTNIFGRKQK